MQFMKVILLDSTQMSPMVRMAPDFKVADHGEVYNIINTHSHKGVQNANPNTFGGGDKLAHASNHCQGF